MRDENEAVFTKMFRLIKMIPTSDELTFFELLRQFHLFTSGIHAVGVKPPRWPFCPLTSASLYWNGCVWRIGLKSTLEPSPYGGGYRVQDLPIPSVIPRNKTAEAREMDRAQSELNLSESHKVYLRVGSAEENQDSPESFMGWSPAWTSNQRHMHRSQCLPLIEFMENSAMCYEHGPLWQVYFLNSRLLGNTFLHLVFKPKEKYLKMKI